MYIQLYRPVKSILCSRTRKRIQWNIDGKIKGLTGDTTLIINTTRQRRANRTWSKTLKTFLYFIYILKIHHLTQRIQQLSDVV